jgi:hypothetical protein
MNKAKVAYELANKGYCGSKDYYYGVKIHILGFKRSKTLPLYIGITPTSNHDLPVFKQIRPDIQDCQIYADKAYIDTLERERLNQQNAEIYTPVKKKKDKKICTFSNNCCQLPNAVFVNLLNLCLIGLRKKQLFK